MDKKTIAAFVLIGVVIAVTPVYQRWLGHKPAGESGIMPPETGVEMEPSREVGAESVQVERAPVSGGFVAREVMIENGMVRAALSTKGGGIERWELKGFEGLEERPVQLVPEGGGGPSVVIEDGGERWDLSEAEFVPDRSELRPQREEERAVTLVADLGEGRQVRERIAVRGTGYDIGLEVELVGFSPGARCALLWEGGIAVTEQNVGEDLRYMKAYTYMGRELEALETKGEGESTATRGGRMDWVGVRNKYFMVSLMPEGGGEWEVLLSGSSDEAGGKRYSFEARREVVAGEAIGVRMYLGPLSYEEVKSFGVGLEEAMDWGWRPLRFLVGPISKVVLKLFLWLHRVIPNYGVVIIVFSVLVKIVVYPLTHKSYESSAKMQGIQPKMAALRERYGDDRERLNREMMRLYKEEGVNPLGSCLPMVLQMPVFFSLYNVFRHTIELRHAEFVPGWIADLSQPEAGVVHILPLLMCGSMFLQQKTMMTDPKQATMMYVMPVMMLLFFWNMPSGLVLYWTMFNILSWAQQRWLMRSRAGS